MHLTPNNTPWTRRQFLQTGLTMASAAATLPLFLNRSAFALGPATAGGTNGTSLAGVPQDKVLVVIQLAGGNDGLNTVIPFFDPAYYNARRGIGIQQRDALVLDSDIGVGLHPAMERVKGLYDDGLMSVIQGVGYPNPNRSHFASMDIWHTAETTGKGAGWLGRYFDNQCHGSPAQDAAAQGDNPCSGYDALSIGRDAPLALQGEKSMPINFESAELFKWTGLETHESLKAPYDAITHGTPDDAHDSGSNADFLAKTTLDARVASDRIRAAVEATPTTSFPRTRLGQELAMVASMIRAGLETRVYYISMGGYDTHAGQGGPQGSHANLLRQFSDAVGAFYDELQSTGHQERVLTMTFSEFGRRVAQNGSGGTDHGTAAPMFLFGPMARAGVLGKLPSLTDLDNGDLKHNLDFRSVYTGVLEDWMGANGKQVLGKEFRKAEVIG